MLLAAARKLRHGPGISDPTRVPAYAVYRDNSEGRTAPVGGKIPNGLGLFDMSGNVWEWVEDCANTNFGKAPSNLADWKTFSGYAQRTNCQLRVIRGGSWGEGV